MPIFDLRQHLQNLEEKDLLYHVKSEVDKDWELACIMRQIIRQPDENNRYAVIFDKIKGHTMKAVVGAVGANRRVYAAGLEINQIKF